MTSSPSWTAGGGSGWPGWSPVPSSSWSRRPCPPTCPPSSPAGGSRDRAGRSGMPDDPVLDRADRLRLAREALARAKADALAKGNRPPHAEDLRPERKPADSPPPRRSGRRGRLADPDRLTSAVEGRIDAPG